MQRRILMLLVLLGASDAKEERVFRFDQDPGLAVGDPVKAAGSSIVRRCVR